MDINKLLPDILCEEVIKPFQVGEHKVLFHQNYIRQWLAENDIPLTFAEV